MQISGRCASIILHVIHSMKPILSPSRATQKARRLIVLLMQEMHAGLRDPSRLSSEQWDKLFGAKQSMIANLQKLVATMGALPDGSREKQEGGAHTDAPPLSAVEVAMLKAWIEERRH